ncbi:F-box/LRR-repeat protein 2-like [Saccostrea cucullata]|uniref:F-box/LRR-repeat protein 2-like n=1 Tax=Saccostrea cuccullata TaxID=36930 RepID=UPI002ECFCA52
MDEEDGLQNPEQDGEESSSLRTEIVHFLEEDGSENHFIVGPGVFRICEASSTVDDGSKTMLENDIKVISNEVENLISSTEKLSSRQGDTSDTQDEQENCFNSLPREIILKIFSFFSSVELCRCVIPVCKQWYDAGHDPSLWKELDFSRQCELPSTVLCRTISRATSLKKLSLMGRLDLSTAEVAVFSQYIPLLESLNLGFCTGVNRTVTEYFVRNCPRLTELNVEGCHTVDDSVTAALPRGERLRSFNFSHCNLTDDSIVLLASAVKRIVSLNIDGISWISDSAVVTLVDNQHQNLEELVLDGAELSDKSFHHIARCAKLKKLHVSFCEGLTDQSLRYIQTLQNLTYLKMRKGVYFTTEGLLSLFTCKSMSHLGELDFSESTQFVNDCVIQMTKCCGPTLQNLALSWCWDITDPGVISIVDHCRNLEVLDIIGLHKITCDRQCNRIIDELIEDVVRKKPDLTVFNYYGEQFVHVKG